MDPITKQKSKQAGHGEGNPLNIDNNAKQSARLGSGVSNAMTEGSSFERRSDSTSTKVETVITKQNPLPMQTENDAPPSSDDEAKPPAHPTTNYTTECATTWSVVGGLFSSLLAVNEAVFASSGDLKITEFYSWILLPISSTAMAISFALKPRRHDLLYKLCLYTQYFVFTIGSTILNVIGHKWRSR